MQKLDDTCMSVCVYVFIFSLGAGHLTHGSIYEILILFAFCEYLTIHLWVLWIVYLLLSENTRALCVYYSLRLLRFCKNVWPPVLVFAYVYLINRGYYMIG